MNQMELKDLDPVAGEIGKLEGVAHSEQSAGQPWQDDAVRLIKFLASRHPYIVSDDLWKKGLMMPGESRALGAAFIKAKKLGYVVATDHFVLTSQSKRHRAPVRVWRSLLLAEVPFYEGLLASRRGETA